jgi:hypothetical protein
MNASLRTSAFSADNLGIWASALCVVHCIATPILISMSAVFVHLIPGEEKTHRTDRTAPNPRWAATAKYSSTSTTPTIPRTRHRPCVRKPLASAIAPSAAIPTANAFAVVAGESLNGVVHVGDAEGEVILTRVEFMEFQPSGPICCSPITGKPPTEVESK